MKSKGIVERKTFVLKFPDENIVPQYLIRHYMRGYFDGDGSIQFKIKKSDNNVRWRWEIISNFDFVTKYAEILYNMIDRKEKPCISREKRRSNPIYYFGMASSSSLYLKRIYDLFYKDATCFLPRKRQKFEDALYLINKRGDFIFSTETKRTEQNWNI